MILESTIARKSESMKGILKILIIVGVITCFTGIVQMSVPSLILKPIGAEINPTSEHFFRIVGMFMFLFGGMQWQVLSKDNIDPIPVFWCGMQKLGASIAVPVGIMKGIFSALALSVALFDFTSAVLIFIYWNRIKKKI